MRLLRATARATELEERAAPRRIDAVKDRASYRPSPDVSPDKLIVELLSGNRKEPLTVIEMRRLVDAGNWVDDKFDPNRFTPQRQQVLRGALSKELLRIYDSWSDTSKEQPNDEERQVVYGLEPLSKRMSVVGRAHEEILFRSHGSCDSLTDAAGDFFWGCITQAGFKDGAVLTLGPSGSTISRRRPNALPAKITQLPGAPLAYHVAAALHPEDVVVAGPEDERIVPARYYDAVGLMLTNDDFVIGRPKRDYALDAAGAPLIETTADHRLMKGVMALRPGGLLVANIAYHVPTAITRDASVFANLFREADLVDIVPVPLATLEISHMQEWPRSAYVLILQKRECSRPMTELKDVLLDVEARLLAIDLAVHEYSLSLDKKADLDEIPDGETAFTFAYRQHLMSRLDSKPYAGILPVRPEESIARGAFFTAPLPALEADHYEGSYVLMNAAGALGRIHDGAAQLEEIPAAEAQVITDMIPVRDALRKVLNTQLASEDEDRLVSAQRELDEVYTKFVDIHGPISQMKYNEILSLDPSYPQLRALESYDPEENVAERSAFFTQRVVGAPRLIEKAETPEQAIALSMGRVGHVSPPLISALLNAPWEEIRRALGDAIFMDPIDGRWCTRNDYLSGNVRGKLESAKYAAKIDPDVFGHNAFALESVQPHDLELEKIEITLGAPWIDARDVERFIVDLMHGNQAVRDSLEAEHGDLRGVSYDPAVGKWDVEPRIVSLLKLDEAHCAQWGTEHMEMKDILRATLNNATAKVYTAVADGDGVTVEIDGTKLERKNPKLRKSKRTAEEQKKQRVIDINETAQAQLLQVRLRDEFARWVVEAPLRAQRIQKTYNRVVNCFVERKIDHAFLKLPGLSPVRQMRSNQLHGIARGLVMRNVLIAHPTGTGKTGVGAGIAVESIRMGLSRKVMLVSPGRLVPRTAAEIVSFFPASRVLLSPRLSPLRPERTQEFIARARLDAWDVIVISQESFKILEMSSQGRLALHRALELGNRRDHVKIRRLDAAAARRARRRNGPAGAPEPEPAPIAGQLCFDDIGVDRLIVDEAHSYKNISLDTSLNVRGLTNSTSQRALDLDEKIQLLRLTVGPSASIVFLTATPLCNSIAEMYTMMRLVDPAILRSMGIVNFDGWAMTFGRVHAAIEQRPAGDGWDLVHRFSRFTNVPEMTRSARMTFDILTEEDIPELVASRPKMDTKLVVSPVSQVENAFITTLQVRSQHAARGDRLWYGDTPIVIAGDRDRAMIDMRLINPRLDPGEDCIINKLVVNLVKFYHEFEEHRGTQLVFMEQGALKKHFPLYHEIRRQLTALGIPEKEIAIANDFGTDAQRERMRSRFNSGRLRILVGSSMILGLGENLQERVVAMHHVDLPQRPDQYIQRIGRGRRQGNQMVRIPGFVLQNLVYAKDGFTSRLGMLETKAIPMRQALSDPDQAERTIEESLEMTFERLQEELINDPIHKRSVEINAEKNALDVERRNHTRSCSVMSRAAGADRESLSHMRHTHDALVEDAEAAAKILKHFKDGQALREQQDIAYRETKRKYRNLLYEARKTILAQLDEKEKHGASASAFELDGAATAAESKQHNIRKESGRSDEEMQAFVMAHLERLPKEQATQLKAAAPDPALVLERDHGFECTINGKRCTSISEFGSAVLNAPLFKNRGDTIKLGAFAVDMKPSSYTKDNKLVSSQIQVKGALTHYIDDSMSLRGSGVQVLKLLARVVEENASQDVRIARLEKRLEEEEIAAKAPFPKEERYQQILIEKVGIDAQLVASQKDFDSAAVAAEMACFENLTFTSTGRPIHPDQLRGWDPRPPIDIKRAIQGEPGGDQQNPEDVARNAAIRAGNDPVVDDNQPGDQPGARHDQLVIQVAPEVP